jgi:hypothetical protein
VAGERAAFQSPVNHLSKGLRVSIPCLTTVPHAGNNSLGVLDLFKALELEAKAAGGKVVTLLGNHELMLITVRVCVGWRASAARRLGL